jgi:hypothetical protein
MATSHDFGGTIIRVAPTGGAVVGTIIGDTSDYVVCLPLTAAASGANFVAKVEGLVKGVSRATGAAWTAGQALAFVSSLFSHLTSGQRVIAHAYAAAASADTTGDVILCLPTSLQA